MTVLWLRTGSGSDAEIFLDEATMMEARIYVKGGRLRELNEIAMLQVGSVYQ